MHPLGTYLVIKDSQREHGWAGGDERRASYARVDATPIVTPEPVSRIGRLAAIVRRRVMRAVGA